ncbi:UbiA prenyltransferase family-domain-containing protein [Hypoxylon sp. NC0597]|nr:UbiA prenyltransferase family-domain-containing protein [Hypoxylon sp. NC0597]
MAPNFENTPKRNVNRNRTVGFHAKTIFLFTKSDLKTVLFPQSAFALSIAFSENRFAESFFGPLDTHKAALRLVYMITWICLHLVVANISNQRSPESIAEDTINRPWRPLVAGRLTTAEAQSLLRIIVILCIAISFLLDAWIPSVTLMTMVWLYNDLEANSAGPWQRGGLNAAGMTCFSWGAVTVLLSDHINDEAKKMLQNWYILMAAAITTTIHAQDFMDITGDKARDRKTMPLLYGEALSRWSLAIFLVSWSLVCLNFWHVNAGTIQGVILAIAACAATLVTMKRGQECDKWVWRLWCLWVTVLYMLPLFGSTVWLREPPYPFDAE